MNLDFDHSLDRNDDPAATTVFLAAEAAVLAERARVLRRQLAEAGARIQETTEKLRGLQTSPSTAVNEEHEKPHGISASDTVRHPHNGRCHEQLERSTPCRA
ncbi:hypothetical protein ABZ642_15815 [Streptomyces sp. NPDC007157]|uniref:hypothetical protein n=1 Tax=Streptomyces sp. NPDC007157 TaxID=3154681 RepID=UPI0033EA7C49